MLITGLFSQPPPVVSMEFFPPRNDEVSNRFPDVVTRLASLSPGFFTVTFGAGGSTKDGTFATLRQLMQLASVPTVAHVAGAGLGPDDLCAVLDQLQIIGVKNIFVVRGDESKDGSFSLHPQGFPYAKDMISFIRQRYDFTIGCAGYPEGHINAESFQRDIEYLSEKVDSGADYILTQYFHDNDFYFRFVEQCHNCGIKVPVIPGIMPVHSLELTQRLSVMCGASIPKALQERLYKVDAAEVPQLGISFAIKQCQELLRYGAPGLHFYTLDRSSSVCPIIASLQKDGLLC